MDGPLEQPSHTNDKTLISLIFYFLYFGELLFCFVLISLFSN